MLENENILKLANWINESKNAVVMTGAGISTASGIPDFRSNDGLYSSKKIDYEYMLSINYFNRNPDEFYTFFKEKMLYPNAKPNDAHKLIAQLEPQHVKAVITQNIDRLHQKAGSKNVIEVHGNLCEYTCVGCGSKITIDDVLRTNGTPRCKKCGGVYRPDIVFYGQQLNEHNIEQSIGYIESCDLMIVIGTSLVVYPVAGFVRYKRDSAKLVIINRDPTPYDSMADLLIRDDITVAARLLKPLIK